MPSPDSERKSSRLFFALWPADSLRQHLVSHCKPLVQATAGRPVPAENLHITLAFLGNVEADQQDCVERMASTIQLSSFALQLNRLGHWARPQVLWFAPGNPPEELTRLAHALTEGARECGLSFDSRSYRPHLTLMRQTSHAPKQRFIEPLSWQVNRFVLVRSISSPQGVVYEVLREWPLAE